MSKRWNEDWQLPEGSGDILGEDWQEAGRREEISDELVDLVIGGLTNTYSKPKTKSETRRKRKKDDILLPEI